MRSARGQSWCGCVSTRRHLKENTGSNHKAVTCVTKECALTPEPDTDNPLLSLVLMTRMAGDQSNGFAWAWFTDILIDEWN